MMCKNEGRWAVTGTVSEGAVETAFYTAVPKYVDWITKKTASKKTCWDWFCGLF